ncbi:hypothetical protein [Amycolatopsis nigrescens]|uniref:hypothetical protein n=1 Tax=Amycolatopsis nigrescens TaxID=381445 RepID=UPI00035D9EB6|nr:hypothetical protein [Amycolatopsis nigrescens]
MPKVDRILANLPPTFRVRGEPSALRALAEAYGGELQAAENSLVAVMRAHWVDFADAGEREIHDLAGIGALYGLAPRPDESVEEFREHLKRYVRTFLDGTVTVQGILRVTAEALGLHIEDDALDEWWNRADPVLVTSTPRNTDAAALVLGSGSAERIGHDALPAVLLGTVELRAGVDLRATPLLRIALDGRGAVPVDLTDGAADPAAVTGAEIVRVLNAEFGSEFASLVDGRLRLVSESSGQDAGLLVADGREDGAGLVLGLRPRAYQGAAATRARVTGTVDLSTPVDLTGARYLRLVIDGSRLAEIDCAAGSADPAAVELDDIATAIDDGLGIAVATHDGRFLTLTSPTLGVAGRIEFRPPAAQPATARLFGPVRPLTVGTDARRAVLAGDRDLANGVDLSDGSRLRLAVDGRPPVTVDIAGADPAATTPAEIVTSVNEALRADIASHDGQRITLVSSSPGEDGTLVAGEVDADAAEPVLGLRPRRVTGSPPATAALTGTVDLSAGVDLGARHLLGLTVDGGGQVEVDLRHGAADPGAVTVEELADAVNHGLGAPADDPVATHDGAHLILVSRDPGAGGRILVHPLRRTSRRRFVTRAMVTDDAGTRVFGFTAGRATGLPPVAAEMAGVNDLSGGVDLSVLNRLRLTVDEQTKEIVFNAQPRPRATTPVEIVDAINKEFAGAAGTDGHRITLTSGTAGADSRVLLSPPRDRDALDKLGLNTGLVRGANASGVLFTGTLDLSAGVHLPADATVRLAVDGGAAADIVLGDGTVAGIRGLSQLVAAVNQAMVAQVAAHDGKHLLLSAGIGLEIAVPESGTDATALVLGIAAPRTYLGSAATSASVTGGPVPAELAEANLLRLAVDGKPPVTVDLSRGAANAEAPTPSEIAAAVNAASTAIATTVPVPGGTAISLRSPSTGTGSRLELQRTGADDAASLIFGTAPREVTGVAPERAVLTGTADLRVPPDLSARSVLRLAVDGGEPVDIDLAGVTPTATLAVEIVAAINAVLPGTAEVTADDRLRLSSPTAGLEGSVELIPLRFLEVQEYPPSEEDIEVAVGHGSPIGIRNTGAAAVPGTVELFSAAGVAGPCVADPVAGWSVRVEEPIGAGGRLLLSVRPDGAGSDTVAATVIERGRPRQVPAELVSVTGTDPLLVRRGLNTWRFYECKAARFDFARFDHDRFAGGPCTEDAIFDLSRFGPGPGFPRAVFAAERHPKPTGRLTVRWQSHLPGAFEVNLPAELDRRFGVAFGDGRFGGREPERFPGVVCEPERDNPDYLEKRINSDGGSNLVVAERVRKVPIGWSPVALPFREPARLSLGGRDDPARLYLSEPGLEGDFILLSAFEPGVWGNEITVTGRASGPAIYDLEVSYPGGRFENARQVVAGPELPALADDLLRPVPGGVLLAKSAGVHAGVTRDATYQQQEKK